MPTRTIFCLRQGKYKPTESYYRKYDAAISIAEIAKCTDTTNIELNRTCAGGDEDDGTRRL